MAVEVYVWFPKVGNIGHAAMKVTGGMPSGDMYLSRWPGSLAAALLIGSGTKNRYVDDVSSEGGPPNVVRLTKLDETAIKSAITVSHRVDLYSFLLLNCATQVGLCLRAGIPTLSPLNAVDTAMNMSPFSSSYQAAKTAAIMTPWNLWAYCQTLRPLYG